MRERCALARRSWRAPLMRGDQNGAPLELAGMHRFENMVDLGERMLLDEGCHLDLAAQDELKRLWVKLRRTAPVAKRPGMKRHQVGKAHLDLVHGEADHAQRCTVVDEAKRSFLAGTRARALEDDP